MGLYAIYIGRLYAIHGTNSNFGIGLRVSQGCIRLRNNDIKYLFDNVPVEPACSLSIRPVKMTTEPDGSRWVEVHEPLSRNHAEFESTRKVPLPISAAQRTQLITRARALSWNGGRGCRLRLACEGIVRAGALTPALSHGRGCTH